MNLRQTRFPFLCAFLVAWAFAAASHPSSAGAAAQDIKNSSDHPLFPKRMQGFIIDSYRQEEFAVQRFQTRPPQEVEGKKTRIRYRLSRGAMHPGALAIHRNYEQAVTTVGGAVLHSDDRVTVMKVTHSGREVWVELTASNGPAYWLTIVERRPMAQVITADAMAASIEKDGFVALDVHFATGKAEILPESRPLLQEVMTMLTAHPDFRVGVEGHTDSTGTPASNKELSLARATSVVAALTEGGIAHDRLQPNGFGQERPVADNRTEEGRAKNRRVEIVKR
jgi:outer membrane protein OmpA-like peptidoglycan-associated protein